MDGLAKYYIGETLFNKSFSTLDALLNRVDSVVRFLKTQQFDPDFALNADLYIQLSLGIRLPRMFLSGAWFRSVDFEKLSFGLNWLVVAAHTIKSNPDLNARYRSLEWDQRVSTSLRMQVGGELYNPQGWIEFFVYNANRLFTAELDCTFTSFEIRSPLLGRIELIKYASRNDNVTRYCERNKVHCFYASHGLSKLDLVLDNEFDYLTVDVDRMRLVLNGKPVELMQNYILMTLQNQMYKKQLQLNDEQKRFVFFLILGAVCYKKQNSK
jgi:hypothetical protein